MKPLNQKERRIAKLQFFLIFGIMLSILFGCGFFTIKTGKKGVDVLEEKYAKYTSIFQEQAALSYEIDNIIKRLYQLKNKNRTLPQHKQFQLIISNLRDEISESIKQSDEKIADFAIYEEMINQVKTIQSVLDTYEEDNEKYHYYEDLLTKCIEKYQEDLSKNK